MEKQSISLYRYTTNSLFTLFYYWIFGLLYVSCQFAFFLWRYLGNNPPSVLSVEIGVKEDIWGLLLCMYFTEHSHALYDFLPHGIVIYYCSAIVFA